METLKKAQLNRSKCDTNSAILPVSRTFSSSMAAEPSSNSSNSAGNGKRGLSPTELMTETLEAAVSSDVKRRIDAIVGDVNKFSDLEKLLLYLKLPTSGINGLDSHHLKSTSPSLTVTRIEQTQAFNWIHSHLEECSETSLPKHEVYEDYRVYCESASRRVLSQADFGKIMKNVFPKVKPRRLGTRGNAKYCYSGLRKKSDIQPPSLPSMDSPRKIGPNDFSRSSSLCKCGEEQHQLNLANTAVICEWADKIFGSRFQTTDELAHHLASNKIVSNSVASFTVLSTRGKDSSSLGMVKLPSTPEERRKETNSQLQRTIHQRQLSRLKEQQANEKNNQAKTGDGVKTTQQWEERKGLSRSHSVPNEIQMNARIESQMGSTKCEEGLSNGSRPHNRVSDQQRNPAQSNNNSNNSNQTAAGSTAVVLTTPTNIKESPNKRRFTPIQPKTPVRDSTVKIPVNNTQVVLVQPNGAIVNAKGQPIQQFPPGVQLYKFAGVGGSSQPMAKLPVQNIPNSKPVAFGSAKSNGSLAGTKNGQNIMVLPQQVIKGSPVAGSVLLVKQPPSASLATNLVSASISGSTASTGHQDFLRTSASQSNNPNVMLQLQSDAGGPLPQGGTNSSHSGIVPVVTSLSPLSNVRGDLSYLPTKSTSCPSSSTVLLRPASVDPHQTSAPNTSNLSVAFNSQTTDFATVQLAQNQSTSVTFATLPMRKEVSEGPSAVLLGGRPEPNIVPSDGRFQSCTTSSDAQIPVNVANSASALLAIFSNSANQEQIHEENRAVKRSPSRMISQQMGGNIGAVQAVNFSPNGMEKRQVSVANQHSNSSTVYFSQGVVTTPKDMLQRSHLATPAGTSFELNRGAQQGLQNTAVTSLTVPIKGQQAYSQSISSSSLMSLLKAPGLETTHLNHQQVSDPVQNRNGGNPLPLTGESLPVINVPIHTSDQPFVSQGSIEMPIAFEVGNKRFALASSNQFVQTSSGVPFQILSQINELPAETTDAVNVNTEVNNEMEVLGSRFQGTQAVLSGGLGVAFGQCTPVGNPQHQVEIDVQGRQSTTPSFNPHSNTSTPIPPAMETIPISPTDPGQVVFKFTPIQLSGEQVGASVTSPSPVKPMQKPKPTHLSTSQGSFATPSRKRRSSGTIRRPNINSTISLPPAVSRQITPTPSPNGSRCSTPLSPSMLVNSQADTASMPPPSPVMIPSDQPTTSRGSINRELCSQTLGQVSWGANVAGSRKRHPSGPPTLMQPAKQISLDAASFLPEDLNDLNIQAYDSSFDLGRAQQQYQRSHSVPLPAYQPVVLSQDRFISNFPTSVDQRGITVNNRSFGAKRNLTQELQVIHVSDEDFNPEDNFLGGGSVAAYNDLLVADLQQPTEGQGTWAGDSSLTGIQSDPDLNVDFPISSCSSEQVTESQLSLAQSLADNSNSTTSTLNEEIAAMDDMGSNPVFRDIALPSWSQIGSQSNLTSLECGM
ncbi:uncharacterized protein [Asterias amurensis]|uniref:uncharacterized protein n=1 Tax=Asterias amurensis TaxID=7602 RepID=UPI003AB3FA35